MSEKTGAPTQTQSRSPPAEPAATLVGGSAPRRQRPPRRNQPIVDENRRVDTRSELTQIGDCQPSLGDHLVERRAHWTVDRKVIAQQLQSHQKVDQPLLRTVMKITGDLTPGTQCRVVYPALHRSMRGC